MAYTRRPSQRRSGRFTAKRTKRSSAGARGYAKSFKSRDRFSTLTNGPSSRPVSFRRGQGSYSRGVYARANVKADLEVKNLDTNLVWSTTQNGVGSNTVTFTTTAANNHYLSTSATVFGSLNNIPQGSNANSREGRKVIVKGIETHLNFLQQTATTADSTAQTVRVITYLDKQCNGSSPLFTDLFTTPATSGENNLFNMNNTQRFVILDDYLVELNSTASLGADSVQVTKNKVSKIVTNIPIEFSTTDGATAGIRSNNIGMMLTGSTKGIMQITGTARCLFVG